jgi:hypothetical protein
LVGIADAARCRFAQQHVRFSVLFAELGMARSDASTAPGQVAPGGREAR